MYPKLVLKILKVMCTHVWLVHPCEKVIINYELTKNEPENKMIFNYKLTKS
jgi:hypothetical protein